MSLLLKSSAFSAALVLGAIGRTHAAGGQLLPNIEYGRAGGERLLLDAHVPDSPGPHPVVILVHGGGWSRGTRSGTEKPGDSADITPWFAPLSDGGFTWFSIDYRLAPQHRWPACLEDVQTAIRWVKAHAAEYRGDATRIALVGHSAGGHLVCLAATLADDSTHVQAVVGFAAVTDLSADVARRGGLSTSLQKLFAHPKEPAPEILAQLRAQSPIEHIHPGLPPFLLLHGTADKSVPYAQSVAFQARLRAAGIPCELITLPDAPHGLLAWTQFAPDYDDRFVAWLHATLGANVSQQ